METRCFISYARKNSDSYLQRFLEDLKEEIVLREDVSDDEAIFVDVEVPSGADWKEDIGEALRQCWVCVTIFTPSYFRRPYCGKEFQVFLDRSGAEYDSEGAAIKVRGIVPVLWSREQDLKSKGLPPRVASRINYTGKKLHDDYVRDGLRHILRRDPQGLYLDLLHQIANDLSDDAFPNAPAPLPAVPSFVATPNPFDDADVPAPAGTEPSPFVVSLFLLTYKDSDGLFSREVLTERLEEFETEGSLLHLTTIHPEAEEPDDLAVALRSAADHNVRSIVVIDPGLLAEYPARAEAFLAALVAAMGWRGSILLPVDDPKAATVEEVLDADLHAPSEVSIELVRRADPGFLSDLRAVALRQAKEIVETGSPQRSLPEGGRPGIRPQIRGPGGKRRNG